MASIYGFSLKGRKTFQGTDGIGNQGNLYYENKKVAWYNDYADGSMATLDFYNGAKGREEYVPILQEAIKKYYGYDDNTIKYFQFYRYGTALLDKLYDKVKMA